MATSIVGSLDQLIHPGGRTERRHRPTLCANRDRTEWSYLYRERRDPLRPRRVARRSSRIDFEQPRSSHRSGRRDGHLLRAVVNTGGGVNPTGTITFVDLTYNGVNPVTTPLGTFTVGGGPASVTTSTLTAGNSFLGNHFITAMYSGDGTFPHVDATLIQKVHASATTTTLNSSPNPSNPGQSVTFTANVAPTPAGSPVPTGMVTFTEGTTVLAQVPLNASGSAAFTTSSLGGGDHTIPRPITRTQFTQQATATESRASEDQPRPLA